MDSKCKQLSPKQKETLVDFVYARPDMYKCKLTATYTKAISMALWKEVTCLLNAIPEGATKDWKQWRKTWTDIKKNVKSKISKEKKYCQGTGGGPPLSPPHGANDMDKTIDEKIFEIITPVAIQGNKEVAESQATFEFEDVLMESAVESEDVLMEMPKRTYEIKEVEDPIQSQKVGSIENEETEGIDVGIAHDHTDYTSPLPKANLSGKAKKEEIKGNMTPRKRYTKSAKLVDSIRNNKKFLEISQKGIISTNSYRGKKLELVIKQNEMKEIYYKKKLEAQEEYYKKKIEILKEMSNSLNKIAAAYTTAET